MAPSEGKKKAIYAVSKELGLKVDWKGLDKLSDEEASRMIDELKAQLGSSKAKNNTGSSQERPKIEINDSRLGMCFKLVYRTAEPGYWQQNKEKFKQEVIAAYILAEETDRAIKSALSFMPVSDKTVPMTTMQRLKVEMGV